MTTSTRLWVPTPQRHRAKLSVPDVGRIHPSYTSSNNGQLPGNGMKGRARACVYGM